MSQTTESTPGTQHVHPQRRTLLLGARVLGYGVYLYLVVTEIVLTLGFFLLLFGANPGPPFVQWAYRSLDRAMEPFRGIFTSIELGQTGNQVEAVLDTSIIFAMIVYGIIAWSVHAGIDWLADRIAHLDRLDEQARRDRAQAQATQQAQAQWAQASQATPEQTRQYPPADPDRA